MASRSASAAIDRGPAKHRWILWIGGFALAAIVLAGLEAIPGFIGHDQSAVLSELIASDAGAAVSKLDPFADDKSTQPCADLESNFGVGNHLFKNRQFGFYASVWPSYQALTALYVASLFPGQSTCSTDFEQAVQAINDNYWDQSSSRSPGAFDQGPRVFHIKSDLPRVDDSLWMGLAIMQQYSRTGRPALLERAEEVFNLATDNWVSGGGIYWEATGANNHAKTVVSNAPAAILGVELYLQTGHGSYLRWSERIMDWLNMNLLDPVTGLYNDSVDDHGRRTIGTTKYTYTQGMMVGAITVLSMVDPARYPLSNAVGLAERSRAYFDAHHSYGQPGFDLLWAENLLWTAAVYHNAAFSALARVTLQRAIAAGPKGQSDLLTSSSESALRQLGKLPSTKWGDLLYVT